jgi:hypothetical protein
MEREAPVLISSSRAIEADAFAMTDVRDRLLQLQFG